MSRFLILSLIIHAIFFGLVCYDNAPIIEDPIVLVELQTEASLANKKKPISNLKKMGSKPKPSLANLKSNQIESPAPSVESSLSPDEMTSSEAALDSQIVTKKPRVVYQVKIEYPLEAEKNRIEGPVKLSVIVDPQGSVTEVKILEGPGYGLNEAAASALRKFRFSPAEKDGKNVSVRITYIYRFRLDSR